MSETTDAAECQWYLLCVRPVAGYTFHPVLGWLGVCFDCAAKHQLVLSDEVPTCLDAGRTDDECEGFVQYRMALSATGVSFPRCEKHWTERLETQQGINERYPEHAPADFDPLYAGESWDED